MAEMKEPKKETVRITLPPRLPDEVTAEEAPAPRINLPNRPPVRPPPPPIFGKPISPVEDEAIATPVAPSPSATPPRPVRPPDAPPFSNPELNPALPAEPPGSSIPSAIAPPGSSLGSQPALPEAESRRTRPGPRKETARVASRESPMKATVRLSSIQPGAAPLAGVVRGPRGTEVTAPALLDVIPRSFCWALLGVSALSLLIQLWIYFS